MGARDGLCCNNSNGHYSISLENEMVMYSIFANTAAHEETVFGTNGAICSPPPQAASSVTSPDNNVAVDNAYEVSSSKSPTNSPTDSPTIADNHFFNIWSYGRRPYIEVCVQERNNMNELVN